MARGSCLCGAVRFEIDGPFGTMINCHCSMCRKQHGSLFATFVTAPLAGFREISGKDLVTVFPSSSLGHRDFCRICGSPLPMVAAEWGIVVAPAGLLEGDLGITQQAHMFVGSKASFHDITDDLPRHAEYPPEYGMKGQERPAPPHRDGFIHGACLCGDIEIEIAGAPMAVYNCHCSRCRKSRGAAYATNFFYTADQVRWLKGEGLASTFKLPEAKRFGADFCRRCGGKTPRVNRDNGVTLVPAGLLDDDPGARPKAHIYTASKAPWDEIHDAIPQFAEMPPTPLVKRD